VIAPELRWSRVAISRLALIPIGLAGDLPALMVTLAVYGALAGLLDVSMNACGARLELGRGDEPACPGIVNRSGGIPHFAWREPRPFTFSIPIRHSLAR